MQARARLDARERAGADEPHEVLGTSTVRAVALDVNADVGLIAIVDALNGIVFRGDRVPESIFAIEKHLQTAGAFLVIRGRKLLCQCEPSLDEGPNGSGRNVSGHHGASYNQSRMRAR